MLYIEGTGRPLRTEIGKHRHGVTINYANRPTVTHFKNGRYSISDMKIQALVSGSISGRKRHKMRLISKLSPVDPLLL